jgi:hypothetical protein
MNNNLLIPAKYKVLGWSLTLIFGVVGFMCLYQDFNLEILNFKIGNELFDNGNNNLTNEIALTGFIIGLLLIVFSKQKLEDEYISLIRLKSLQLSILISYLIFIILNFSFYGLNFYEITFYNTFTVLAVFIITFQIRLFKLRNEGLKNEE